MSVLIMGDAVSYIILYHKLQKVGNAYNLFSYKREDFFLILKSLSFREIVCNKYQFKLHFNVLNYKLIKNYEYDLILEIVL